MSYYYNHFTASLSKMESTCVNSAGYDLAQGRKWGERGDSNPRPPGPQPGALTD